MAQLPAYYGNALLDFSGLNAGVDSIGDARQRWQREQQARDIGGKLAAKDYGGAEGLAYGFGDLDTGMRLSGMQADKQNALLAAQREAANQAYNRQWKEKEFNANQEYRNRSLSLDERKMAQAVAGGGNEYGLQPVWGKDANGNTVILQLGKMGNPNLVKMPDGVTVDPSQIVQDKAAAKAIGESQGKAATSIPGIDSDVERMGKQIDELIASPGLDSAVGPLQSRLPTVWGGTADAEARIEQLKGAAFLQAIPQMVGMGALSNMEGATATAAIARLQTAQSEAGFKQALKELKAVFDSGRQRVRAKAGPYAPGGPKGNQANIPQISNEADYQALPSGSTYMSPDGQVRTKR